MFKRIDFFIIVAVILFSLSVYVYGFYRAKSNQNNKPIISVYQDKKLIKSVSLSSAEGFEIKTEYGYNIIAIDKGAVFITDADCASKDCMKTGKISRINDFIICLPHKLLIRIEGETDIEAVSY